MALDIASRRLTGETEKLLRDNHVDPAARIQKLLDDQLVQDRAQALARADQAYKAIANGDDQAAKDALAAAIPVVTDQALLTWYLGSQPDAATRKAAEDAKAAAKPEPV